MKKLLITLTLGLFTSSLIASASPMQELFGLKEKFGAFQVMSEEAQLGENSSKTIWVQSHQREIPIWSPLAQIEALRETNQSISYAITQLVNLYNGAKSGSPESFSSMVVFSAGLFDQLNKADVLGSLQAYGDHISNAEGLSVKLNYDFAQLCIDLLTLRSNLSEVIECIHISVDHYREGKSLKKAIGQRQPQGLEKGSKHIKKILNTSAQIVFLNQYLWANSIYYDGLLLFNRLAFGGAYFLVDGRILKQGLDYAAENIENGNLTIESIGHTESSKFLQIPSGNNDSGLTKNLRKKVRGVQGLIRSVDHAEVRAESANNLEALYRSCPRNYQVVYFRSIESLFNKIHSDDMEVRDKCFKELMDNVIGAQYELIYELNDLGEHLPEEKVAEINAQFQKIEFLVEQSFENVTTLVRFVTRYYKMVSAMLALIKDSKEYIAEQNSSADDSAAASSSTPVRTYTFSAPESTLTDEEKAYYLDLRKKRKEEMKNAASSSDSEDEALAGSSSPEPVLSPEQIAQQEEAKKSRLTAIMAFVTSGDATAFGDVPGLSNKVKEARTYLLNANHPIDKQCSDYLPGFEIEKLENSENRWSMRLTKNYRLEFTVIEDPENPYLHITDLLISNHYGD